MDRRCFAQSNPLVYRQLNYGIVYGKKTYLVNRYQYWRVYILFLIVYGMLHVSGACGRPILGRMDRWAVGRAGQSDKRTLERNGRTDGRSNGWLVGRNGRTIRRAGEQTVGRDGRTSNDGQTDGRSNERGGRTDGRTDWRAYDRVRNGRTDAQSNEWTLGRTVGWTDD